jgi:hypothetical protein
LVPITHGWLKICPVDDRLVRVSATPFADLVGHLRDPGAVNEPEPGILDGGQVGLGQHPGVGDHGHLGQLMGGGERLHHRQDGLVSACSMTKPPPTPLGAMSPR